MFHDRAEAGRRLAAAIAPLDLAAPVVFALPRGGVPVAAEVAAALHCPMRLAIVRKIGHPRQPELALGAILDGEPPVVVRNEALLAEAGLDEVAFQELVDRERPELLRRRALFASPPVSASLGSTAVVIDDGLATGATARAAIEGLRAQGWKTIVLAVPVAPAEELRAFEEIADRVVCPAPARRFSGVGAFYDDFHQLGDDEVLDSLSRIRLGA